MAKKKLTQKILKKWKHLLICFGIMGICLTIQTNDSWEIRENFENKLLDIKFKMRGELKESGQVGILAIDEASLQEFGRWPIPRATYDQAFKNLKKLGGEWVGFDIVWSEPQRALLDEIKVKMDSLKETKNFVANSQALRDEFDSYLDVSLSDRKFAETIIDYKKIVLGFFLYLEESEVKSLKREPFHGLDWMQASFIESAVFEEGFTAKSFPSLHVRAMVGNIESISTANPGGFAFFSNEADDDAIVRKITLIRELDGKLLPSLSLQTIASHMDKMIVPIFDKRGTEEIMLMDEEDDAKNVGIPTQEDGRMLLNHLGRGESIPHFSFVNLYKNNFSKKAKKSIKGRSLLIGPTAIGINDQRASPFDPAIMGVENHAAAMDNIVSKRFIKRPKAADQNELFFLIVLGLVFAPILVYSSAFVSGSLAAGLIATIYLVDHYLLFSKGQWYQIGLPLVQMSFSYVAVTFFNYVTEEREKKKVRGTLNMYLAPEVAEQMLDDPEALYRAERKEITTFFSDVRGFTGISETLSPLQLSDYMNRYFTPMTNIVMEHKGVLDKFIGDAIMAFWGHPLEMPNHAELACDASLKMLLALDQLYEEFKKIGYPPPKIGIGLNTGLQSVGNMGSKARLAYTVMGDETNLASRIESLTKEYGVQIMISESTRKAISHRTDYFLRDLDDIQVKGRNKPVKVFELMRPDCLPRAQDIQNLIGEFELGRRCYSLQQWDQARRHFKACKLIKADDKTTDNMLERINDLEKRPVIANWDGVHKFEHK